MFAGKRAHLDWPSLAIVVAAATVPYLNALGAGFAFDDGLVIRQNPVITGAFDLGGIFGPPHYPVDLYRPLTVLTYALNERVAPGYAPLFHAVNLVLHVGVTLLVFQLGLQLCRARSVALIAAVLFGVHPIHTEAVTGIVGRAELLAAFFGLLTLVWTISAADDQNRTSGRDGLALLAFTAAVFCKESALTVLPLIPLCRAVRRGGRFWPALWHELRTGHWLPFLIVSGLFLATRTYVIGTLTLPDRPLPLDNVLAYTPAMVRIRTAFAVLSDYASLLAMPIVLSADYSWRAVSPVSSWFSLRPLLGLGLVVGSIVLFLRSGRRNPALGVLAIFPLVTLSLASNLVIPIGTVKAERLLYLPSVGCALLAASLLQGLRPKRAWLQAAVVALIAIAFAARTWARNLDWQNNLTLFQAAVEAEPESAKAHHNLGVTLQELGRADEANIQFREALRVFPGYAESAFCIGQIYQAKGLDNGAISWYRKALAIAPSNPRANENLCSLLLRRNDYAAAEAACRHGLRFAPADAGLLKGVGASLLGLGDQARGVAVLRRSLALNPDDQELRSALAHLEGGRLPSG
jgi:Flp pilus assembly protein TadD